MSTLDKQIARMGDKEYAHQLIKEANDDSLIIVLVRDCKREELAMTVVGGYDAYTTELLGLLAYGQICAARKFDGDVS